MQVDGLLKGISGIYGGMQFIAGTALPQVKVLKLPKKLNSKYFEGLLTTSLYVFVIKFDV